MGAPGFVIRDDVGAVELRRFAQGEPGRRAAWRALAIAQVLEGASRADAARVVGRKRESLRDAVVRYVEPKGSPDNAEGLKGPGPFSSNLTAQGIDPDSAERRFTCTAPASICYAHLRPKN